VEVASTDLPSSRRQPADWQSAGLCYFSRNFFYRNRFGFRVWKVSLDAGLGCPNRDGTLATGGCVFCDPDSFSPSRRGQQKSVTEQLAEGTQRVRARRRVDRFVAYFQPATNTYAPVERLEDVYQQAISYPNVVGLAIGTRPDCAGDAVLDLLAELSQRTWLSVEYGLQTIHNRTLDWMNRGHHYDAFLDAHRRSRQRGLNVGVHVILGLPGESPDDMLATAGELARLRIDSVKLHNLYAVRNTPLAELVAAGTVQLPSLDEYVRYAVDFLERLPPSCVIDRLSGDAPSEYLVGPQWCGDKSAVRTAIQDEFRRRGSRQGQKYCPQ
jgi:radical SAM protein (TIGR01212 family)